jgi:hypothetical protein
MHLLEVMVAATVFTAASGSSLQLFAQAASRSQAADLRQQQLERIELDRLQLEAHWRHELDASYSCAVSPEQLRAWAARVPVPPQIQRELLAGDQIDELRLRWRLDGQSAVVRERLVTTAGLGAHCKASDALIGSQPEGVE